MMSIMVAGSASQRQRASRSLSFAADPVSGADSYNLYSGDSPGVYGVPINIGSTPKYTMSHPGVARYYALTCVIGAEESDFSDELNR